MILIGKLLWYYHDCNDILNIIKNKQKKKTKTHRNRIDHIGSCQKKNMFWAIVCEICNKHFNKGL